jgi:hypothetical protein
MDDDHACELEAVEGILCDPGAEPIKLSYGLMKFITKTITSEVCFCGFGVVYQLWSFIDCLANDEFHMLPL